MIGAGILVVAFTLAIFVIREVAAPAHGHAEHEAIGEPAFAEDLA